MSYQVHSSRRIPPRSDSRKRKEREEEYGSFKQPSSAPSAQTTTMAKPMMSRSSSTTQPVLSSNRLLAGYMAYEFITRGTLLGQECCSAAQTGAEPRRWGEAEPIMKAKAKAKQAGSGEGAKQETYGEVATLLKTDGAHIPEIVNPTQLARWIQM